MVPELKKHPCIGCGACCASFRVAFDWRAADSATVGHVPSRLTESLDINTSCMKGTAHKHKPQCKALNGKIGLDAHCSIYELRPSPCRRFSASYEFGEQELRCDFARRRHGIAPLTKADWSNFREVSPSI